MEMLRESSPEVDLSKGSGDGLGGPAAAVGRLVARIGPEAALEDALKACENGGRIGGAVDDRGGAQPALLAVADIDRGHADGRRLQNAAGGVADHGVGKPQRGPVALAAERGEEMGAIGTGRDKGRDRIV